MGKNMSMGNINDDILEYAYELLSSLEYVKDKNDHNAIYVSYIGHDGTSYFENICSEKFQRFVRNEIRKEMNVVTLPRLTQIFGAIRDNADEYQEVEINTRFAGNDNEIVYFLASQEKPYIRITPEGVEELDTTDYYFKQTANMIPQVQPKKTKKGLYKLLRKYVNLNDDDYKLFLVYLCQLFMHRTSHMICVISSSKGTGKSTLTRIMKRVVDPSKAENSLVPNSTDELINHCYNNNIVCFDNTKCLSSDESDILCAATTGTTVSKRTLYTTAGETLLYLKNIIIINGIDIIPKKTDFNERSLLFELKKISKKNRMSENEFFRCFEEDKPYIMYRIFMTISEAMKVKKTLELSGSHRMYDAFYDMCAIAIALGFDVEEFQKIFFENNKKLDMEYAENNAFVSAIVDCVNCKKGRLKGSATKVYMEISKYYRGNDFPGSASAFSRKLTQEKQAINDMGFEFQIDRTKSGADIIIKKK